MQKYDSLGHITRVESNKEERLYLPYHGVVKEDRTSTKLRVVFDASAQMISELCLNNVLMVGPVIQPDLVYILNKFHIQNYVLTADIENVQADTSP